MATRVLCLLLFYGAYPAQSAAQSDSQRLPVNLLGYVPQTADLVVSIRALEDFDGIVDRAHAWPLLFQLLSVHDRQPAAIDLTAFVRQWLGAGPVFQPGEFEELEMVIAAPSLRQLSDAIFLFRAKDPSVMDRWFPRHRRMGRSAEKPSPLFRMDTGETVCLREDVAAVAPRGRNVAFVRGVIGLMFGHDRGSLNDSLVFQQMTKDLSGFPTTLIYLRGGATPMPSASKKRLEASRSHVVLGLFATHDGLTMEVRAALNEPKVPAAPPASLESSTLERLRRLPATTMLACAAAWNVKETMATAAAASPAPPLLWRYIKLLAGFRDPERAASGPFPALGPNVIVVWGQDLSPSGTTPQIALLVPAPEPEEVAGEVGHIFTNLLRVLQALEDGVVRQELVLRRTRRLGTRITSVPLEQYAKNSKLPVAALLSSTEPAWAALDGWFVIALTRAHLEQIVDAHHGLLPALGSDADVTRFLTPGGTRSLIALGRPVPASEAMVRWLQSYQNGSPSLLDPSWWDRPGEEAARTRYLGIEPTAQDYPGVVVVSNVYEKSWVEGTLRAGDRVVGINGQLLDWAAPKLDLRRQLARIRTGRQHVFRVLRDDRMQEVRIPVPATETASVAPIEPADAIRLLTAIGQSIDLATLQEAPLGEGRRAMRLRLSFSPPPDD